ncbi:MAG: zinc ribbon domain-containing protein [Gammaproteobacteria bacterium]|nr:zinc ribbon domain-containing protein [Gammaproteobacteria bacterium]
MPIYEYECDKCGHKFELLVKISDPPPEHCPECNAPAPRKLISRAGFQLKGTGWYVTDFRDNAKSKNTGSAGSGGDAKPAASTTSDSSSTSTADSGSSGSGSSSSGTPGSD